MRPSPIRLLRRWLGPGILVEFLVILYLSIANLLWVIGWFLIMYLAFECGRMLGMMLW